MIISHIVAASENNVTVKSPLAYTSEDPSFKETTKGTHYYGPKTLNRYQVKSHFQVD